LELDAIVTAADATIRDLDESRLEAAVKLWESSESNDALAFSLSEVLAAVVAREPALVALAGDRVIGAIAARVDGERAWILRWTVEANSRRRGIGASLLGALERRLQALGVREISMLAPRDSLGTETAAAKGYLLHEDTLYLEKRQLHATAADERIEELGGQWPSAELWLAIGGMDREKDLIERRVILPLAEREEARRHGVVPASSVILFGPPGTGKTTFAKAIAGRLGWPFVEVFPSQLPGTDAHGRAGALRKLFDRLTYLDNVVVFIDEVEDIASARQTRPETHVIANELLKVIPNFRDGGSRLLVCATNSVRDLDHAFTRPGRFDYLVPVGPPDASARRGIWARYVSMISTADDDEIDLDELSACSQYFSAADIEFAAQKAAQAAFERSLQGDDTQTTTDDFVRAASEVRPSISNAMARDFDEDIERFARF
jgi:transitional endoplasmic reticulum ATPase